jgi:hypothetical protein
MVDPATNFGAAAAVMAKPYRQAMAPAMRCRGRLR